MKKDDHIQWALGDAAVAFADSLAKRGDGGSCREAVRYGTGEDGARTASFRLEVDQDDGTGKIYQVTLLLTVEESVDNKDSFWGEPSPSPDIWRQPVDIPESRRVVVGGRHYSLGDGTGFTRGFGGRRFDIEFFDGRQVTCTDLWSQGVIPPKWREKYPDNARFMELDETP